jgi:hypothetical protein
MQERRRWYKPTRAGPKGAKPPCFDRGGIKNPGRPRAIQVPNTPFGTPGLGDAAFLFMYTEVYNRFFPPTPALEQKVSSK